MSILKELLPGQHIRIDNHHRGQPMKWDWEPGEQPDDIHLDKTMNRKVNGKEVQIRVSLNNDGSVKIPHRKFRNNRGWMDEYNRVKDEVREALVNDTELTKDFVKSVKEAIQVIGPHKDRRAVRMALERIGEFFGLDAFPIRQLHDDSRGVCCLYSLPQQRQFYAAFGYDYAFYFGEGGKRDYQRHSRVTGLWGHLCRELDRCPTLQDLVDYYMDGRDRKQTRKGMEDELNFVATVLNSEGVWEEKKAETLLVPESHDECPVRRTHLWRLRFHEERGSAIHAIVANHPIDREYSSFGDVMASVSSVLLPFPQIGGLAVYDIAKRIWWAQGHRSLETDYVILAQGAYDGARCVVGNIQELGYETDKSVFPSELSKLDALYIEDFLCVMKNELEIMYNV